MDYQTVVDKARKDWDVKEKITFKFDNKRIIDPFTLGYIMAPEPILYLRSKQLKRLNPPNEAIKYCIYHEMGHFKQEESGIFKRRFNPGLLKATYEEFTNETSTIILLNKKGLNKIILKNINYHKKLIKKYRLAIPLINLFKDKFLEYYPYIYAYKRAGKILRDKEIKRSYSELIEFINFNNIDNLEKIFNNIKLKKKGNLYYIPKNIDKKINKI